MVSSVFNYFFQALGILIFSLGLVKLPKLFGNRKLFILLLVTGSLFMTLSQLANSGLVIEITGYVFNLHIGIYFGFYLTLLSRFIPPGKSGICFGLAYAIASLGTYLFSLVHGGTLLVSKEVTALYLILASITIFLVYWGQDLIAPSGDSPLTRIIQKSDIKELQLNYLIPIIIIAMTIFIIGSGLFYSLPVAESVNWNLIRAFYAVGLILAGFIMDKNRFICEVLVIASLTYPLIMLTLVGGGITGTVALSISYIFRGFISIYYVISFTNIGYERLEYLYLAPVGLFVSRLTETIIAVLFLNVSISNIAQLIFSAALFLPLLALFVIMASKRMVPEPMSDAKRFALYSEKYGLTSREMEVLKCLAEGLSDSEIAERCFISKNTVRFHISNLLKKTSTTSRVEVVQELNKF